MKTRNALGLVGALTLGILAAQTAAAERPAYYERTARAPAGDLDLSLEHDAHVLLERIRHTARRLCLAGESTFPARRASRRRSCVQEAVDAAVERAGVPMLTAVHLQQDVRLAQR